MMPRVDMKSSSSMNEGESTSTFVLRHDDGVRKQRRNSLIVLYLDMMRITCLIYLTSMLDDEKKQD